MKTRAVPPWTCGLLAAALILGGCGGASKTMHGGLEQAVERTPAEVNRARIEQLRARQQAQPGFDAGPGFLSAYEDARSAQDVEGAAFAAALLIHSGEGELDLPELLQELGQAVVDGLQVSEDASMLPSMRAALTTVCARGLQFEGACESTRAFAQADPEIVGVWIEQGYRHLQMGDFEKAGAVLEQLRGISGEGLAENDALLAVEIALLEAAVMQLQAEGEANALEASLVHAGQAIQMLAASFQGASEVESEVESEEIAAQLFRLSEQFRARGIDGLARFIGQRRVEFAAQAENPAELAEATAQLAKILQESGRWQELLDLEVTVQGSRAARVVRVYQSHAAAQLGDKKRARALLSEAFAAREVEPSLEDLQVALLAAWLEVSRGELAQAASVLERVGNVEAGGADLSEDGRAVRAGLLGLQAEVLARQGHHARAREFFGEALAMLAELPVDASPQIRVAVLEAWGTTAQNVGQFEDAFDQLSLFRTQLSLEVSPLAARDASAALARLALIGADAALARMQLRGLAEGGLAPASSRVATACLQGKVGVYGLGSGAGDEDDAARLTEIVRRDLQQCAEFSAEPQAAAEARWLLGLAGGIEPEENPAASVQARVALTRAYQKTLRGVQAREQERLKYFLEVGSQRQESGDASVRSGIAFLLASLRPVEAQAELVRVLRENPDLDASVRMDLEFLRLQMFLLLGQWHEAAYVAADCEAFAAERKDRQRLASVRALVKRFSL